MMMNHKKTCCVCFTSEKVHKFPQGKGPENAERFTVWANFAALENVLDDQKCYTLCEKHFERRMFLNDLSVRLVKPAFPTLHPPIYYGPLTEEETRVNPCISKSETFILILKWKEELLAKTCPTEPYKKKQLVSGPVKNLLTRNQDHKQGSKISTLIKNKKLPRSKGFGLKSQTINSLITCPSTNIDLSESKFIQMAGVIKTYSRKDNVVIRNEVINNITSNLNPKFSEPQSDSSFDKNIVLIPSEKEMAESLEEHDEKEAMGDNASSDTNIISPLWSVTGRIPSPIKEMSDLSLLQIDTDDMIPIPPSSSDWLYDIDMDFSLSNIIPTFIDKEPPPESTDLLSKAIKNADILFNEDSSGLKKRKKDYDPTLIDSLLEDVNFVENLLIYNLLADTRSVAATE